MTPIALGLLALYVPFGLLLYGMSHAARRADTLDARARAIAKQNVRRRKAALAAAHGELRHAGIAVV